MSGTGERAQESRTRELVTTLGPKGRGELDVILPHEHVFLDLRTWESPEHSAAEKEDVVRRVAPEISRARKAGATAIVEPTTLGVGRRADVLAAVSEATGMPLVPRPGCTVSRGYRRGCTKPPPRNCATG